MEFVLPSFDFNSNSDGILKIQFYVGQRLVCIELETHKSEDLEKTLNNIFANESIPEDVQLNILSSVHSLLREERLQSLDESELGKYFNYIQNF